MEPAGRLHEHVQRGDEVVAAAHVDDLVRDNRVDLLAAQTRLDAVRPQQDGAHDAEDAGLEGRS